MTNEHLVSIVAKAGWRYLIIRIQNAGSRTVYWQATGIRADQPRYLVEQARRRVLAELYEEARCEAQCEAWGVDYALRQQPPSAWLAHWLEDKRESVCERSFRQYAVVIRRAGAFLDTQADTLTHLTPYGIEQYLDSLRANGMAETTLGLHVRVLHMALQAARDCGLIQFNPASGIAIPRTERDIPAPYTPAELQQLLVACHGTDLYLPVLLAATYGMRRGEVCGLCWEDVDLDAGQLQVRRNAVMEHDESGRCRMVCSEVMKTRASRRSFPLSDDIRARLERRRAQIAQWATQPGYYTADAAYIFVREDGRLMPPSYVTDHFRQKIARSGLPRLRFHDLRHTCATLLLHEGCTLREIQAYLGHATYITTTRYAHVDARSKERALGIMTEALHQD